MKPEDLLKPRYKVIADYPGNKLKVGDILIKYVFPETENYCYVTNPEILLLGDNLRKEEVEQYPHLFKKLEWWEERKPEDMPEYVKCGENGKPRKVKEWNMRWGLVEFEGGRTRRLQHQWIPSTEQEYNSYLSSKKQ